jgi:hypothetical protein
MSRVSTEVSNTRAQDPASRSTCCVRAFMIGAGSGADAWACRAFTI